MNLWIVGVGLVIVGAGLKWLMSYRANPADPVGSYLSETELTALNRKLWRQGDQTD